VVKLALYSAFAVMAVVVSAPADAKSLTLECQATDSIDPGQRTYGIRLLNQDYSVGRSPGGWLIKVPRMVLVPRGTIVSIEATRVTPTHPTPVKVPLSLKLTSDLPPGKAQILSRPPDSLLRDCTAVANW
jgi:hypothetical protein